MTETALSEPAGTSSSGSGSGSGSGATNIPRSVMTGPVKPSATLLRSQLAMPSTSPLNLNGSFAFDRVIKSGYVQRRTQKTKVSGHAFLELHQGIYGN